MSVDREVFSNYLTKAIDSLNSQKALKLVKSMEIPGVLEKLTPDEKKCISKALAEYFDREAFVGLHSTEGGIFDIETDRLPVDIEKSFDYYIQD